MGAEATPGTHVAATTIWRGIGTINDERETAFTEEDIGILSGVDRTYVPKVEAGLTLDNTEATYEQLPYIFEMGVRSVDPTTDATSDGIFSYTVPVSSTDMASSTDLGTYTIEGGDNQAVERFAYAFCPSFTLSGSAGGALMMSADLVGREVAPTTDGAFTTGLSIPAVEEILVSKGTLFIDDAGGTIGSTQRSNTLLTINLSYNSGWTPVYTADGELYFSFVKQAVPELILDLTFEHDDISVAEKANWRAETARLIRLHFDGASTDKALTLDMAGKWDNFDKIGEQDGNDIVTGAL